LTTLTAILSRHPVFVSLNQESIQHLVNTSLERRYQKGEFITQQGDVWPYLFIISDGIIQAIKISPEGRHLQVETFGPGDVFWGLAFFHADVPMPVSLEAFALCKIYLWQRETLQSIIFQYGEVAWELSRLMAAQMMRASTIVDGLAFQPVAGRVANFLLDQYPIDQQSLPRNLTLDEMAARTGTTREVVCRILQRFANNGAIEITRTELSIMDREKLAQIADKY